MATPRGRLYTVNLNIFISEDMDKNIKEAAKEGGFLTVSTFVRKCIALGVKEGLKFEE